MADPEGLDLERLAGVDGSGKDPLGLLARMSQAFASSLDIGETLQNAVDQITHYMHAEAASLFLLENDDRELVCRACAGPVDLVGLRLGADQGIVGRTTQDGTIEFIRDVRDHPDFARFVDASTGFETRSILCAPLTVKGQRLGALEVLNKDSSDRLFEDSDQHLLQVLASSAALVIHNARMAMELLEQERLRKELELAREIQANLLPKAPHPGGRVAGLNHPAREVSGDFFDHFDLPDGRIGFNLGDVSGKGMNAALLMAKTSSLLHCLGKEVLDPAELLRRVNGEVCESATRGMFVTLVAGVFDPASARVTLANAGHLPPLLVSPGGGWREFPAAAPPLGVVPGMEFTSESVDLEGGALYLYSDGVTESRCADGRVLEKAGLLSLVAELRGLPPRERLEALGERVIGHHPQRVDDVTLLVIEGGP